MCEEKERERSHPSRAGERRRICNLRFVSMHLCSHLLKALWLRGFPVLFLNVDLISSPPPVMKH